MELNDAGEIVVVGISDWSDSLYYSSVVSSLRLSPQGEFISSEHFWDPPKATYPGWSNSTNKRSDGGFVVGGSNFNIDSLDNWLQRPVLYFLNAAGGFEQFIELGPENQEWIGRQAKQTPDGGYVICGETSSVGNALQAFVIKTDAQGNEEWTRTYGGANNDYAMAIDTRPGGGYFLGGEYWAPPSNSQLWVQALNDTGGVVWDKKWGSSFDEPNAHLTTAADGHVLVASAWAYGDNYLTKRYLAKLDAADGTIIWQRQYGSAGYNYPVFYVVQEIVSGGDLIAVGPAGGFPNYYGVLLRTTSSGDSLWMRQYQYHDSIVSNASGLFRDVVPTPDGGFIAVGTALQAGPYTQDVWVIKTDSMGCLEPGCHLIMGMESQITNLRDALSVAPNPVASGGMVHVSVKLPESLTPQGPLRLTVTDATGRMVHELQLPSPAGQLTTDNWLNLQLPAGLYHLHLHDATRWISGAKLMVE
ncbi:MAG: PQQ-like beta-propeller repeat protein [Flavobacteriales bacterium]|nr:PQQ-like beta-propeller repeat protein [Flavobacteriales bacterium]